MKARLTNRELQQSQIQSNSYFLTPGLTLAPSQYTDDTVNKQGVRVIHGDADG
jgi:hypothetical protein